MPFQSLVGKFGTNPTVAVIPSLSLTNSGGTDALIAKYNTNGGIQWAARISGLQDYTGISVESDSSGNVYAIGNYSSNPATVFNANGTSFGTLTNSGSSDTYIVKYNTSGTVQWTTRISGAGGEDGLTIYVDASGNVYASGYYDSSPVTFFNANGTSFGTRGNSGGDVFVVKYNTNGAVQWTTQMTSDGRDDGNDITVDSSGNVYVCGSFTGGTTLRCFSADGVRFATLSRLGTDTGFVVKYNSSGTGQWASRITTAASNSVYAKSIDVDSTGNVYVIGYYSGTVTFYNADGTAFGTTLANASAGFFDVLIGKYNTDGAVQWVARAASSSNASKQGYGISTDSSGNVYIVGYYAGGTFTFYNSNGNIFTSLGHSAGSEVFVVKYNTGGTGQWAARMTGSSTDQGLNIDVDTSANVYVIGNFYSSTLSIYDRNDVLFTTLTKPSGSNSDKFAVKYNTDGSVQWATRIATASIHVAAGISTDSTGNVYISGIYNTNATLYSAGF